MDRFSTNKMSLLLGAAIILPLACATAHAQSGSEEQGAATEPVDNGDIVVTARHQAESALTVPESITAFGEKTLVNMNIQSFNDYATKVPNLGFSYGSATGVYGFAGSKTIAIRGISGSGTTAYYIDDTPIPESVDPQVVDIQRIEVLKGPRGTLFGQGSLGGNIRLITNRPSLTDNDIRFSAEGGFTKHGDSPDYVVNGVGNIVLAPDKLGLRVVGFTSHRAGFYSRTYPTPVGSVIRNGRESSDNQGASSTYGGSMSLRAEISDTVTANLRIMGQQQDFKGYPAVYTTLPRFKPDRLILEQSANIQERAKDAWYLPSLELAYNGDAVQITSSTSYFKRKYSGNEDGTDQMNFVLSPFYDVPIIFGPEGNTWVQHTRSNAFNQEVRASFTGNDWISGVVGTRYGDNDQTIDIESNQLDGLAATGKAPNDIIWYSTKRDRLKDYSVFGEAYLKYSGFELTLGLRQYWLRQRSDTFAEGLLAGDTVRAPNVRSKASGLNPKVALSYKLGGEGLIYVSASKGFRAGRANVPVLDTCLAGLVQKGLTPADVAAVKPDSVWNYEAGIKRRIGRLTATATAFQMDWKGIQQSLTIPICQVTVGVNAGAARSRGIELELAGELTRGLDVRLGFGYNNAKITEEGISGQAVGDRIYQVPKFTASAAAMYSWTLSSTFEGFVGGDVSYTGNSVSNVARGNPVRPSYEMVNTRFGVRTGKIEAGIYVRNLFDVRANLGDLNPLSFPKLDSNFQVIPRTVVAQPRQMGVSFKYNF